MYSGLCCAGSVWDYYYAGKGGSQISRNSRTPKMTAGQGRTDWGNDPSGNMIAEADQSESSRQRRRNEHSQVVKVTSIYRQDLVHYPGCQPQADGWCLHQRKRIWHVDRCWNDRVNLLNASNGCTAGMATVPAAAMSLEGLVLKIIPSCRLTFTSRTMTS